MLLSLLGDFQLLLLPRPQRRPTSGDVVALGDGQVGTKQHAFTLKVGQALERQQHPGSCWLLHVAVAAAAAALHAMRLRRHTAAHCLLVAAQDRDALLARGPSLTLCFLLQGGETILYSKFGIGVTELEVQVRTLINPASHCCKP